MSDGPLDDAYLIRQTHELGDQSGDVDVLLGRTARLRTWAFVANRPGWVTSGDAWCRKLSSIEDELSDALHRGLVASFVERQARSRAAAKRPALPMPSTAPGELERPLSVDPHHPFAGLSRLRARVHDPRPEPLPASTLEELIDAPHESFELDEAGNILASGLKLAELYRGSTLTQPQVRLAPLEQLPAGARSRLQRRLLAYARDVVGRLLEPLEPLERSDRAPLRAIAYQLERGLGCTLSADLGATLGALTEQDRDALNRSAVKPGQLAVFVPELLRQRALLRRLTLVRAFEPSMSLPPVGRAAFPARGLAAAIWLALGYVVLDRRAFRVDLAERVAASFREGESPAQALECLALPKREWASVTASFRSALGST